MSDLHQIAAQIRIIRTDLAESNARYEADLLARIEVAREALANADAARSEVPAGTDRAIRNGKFIAAMVHLIELQRDLHVYRGGI